MRWWSRSTRAATWCKRGDRARRTASVPVTAVRATRGKWLRAEPIAALYEQGRVKHAGVFPGAGGRDVRLRPRRACRSGRSPDRLDALVWAVSALTFAQRAEPENSEAVRHGSIQNRIS